MRLKGSTVLLVMVYLTTGLAESGERLEKMWELANPDQGPRATVHFHGRLDYDSRGNAENRIGKLHWRGDQDSCGRRVHLHIWKQTLGLRVGRLQAGKRGPGGTLLGRPMEISRCSGGHSLQSTAYSYNENCVHTKKKFLQRKSVGQDDWDKNWATRQGPLFETQREDRLVPPLVSGCRGMQLEIL